MLLSMLIDKTLILDKAPRGMSVAVGISPKNKTLKYLFCASKNAQQADFVLPISAVSQTNENALFLSRMRPILPKSYHKLTLNLPVYTDDGVFLGRILNIKFLDNVASALQTNDGIWYPFSRVIAIADAVLLKKAPPYPIGQPIPKRENFVTKQELKRAVKEERLIKLTLSLPPFSVT